MTSYIDLFLDDQLKDTKLREEYIQFKVKIFKRWVTAK
jgi:hypothetical protein